MSETKPTVGRIVLYQTDERGGLRYALPAMVACTRDSHPGDWSVDPRAEHPVPVPSSDQHVHLVVFTPGKGTYVEHDVPFDDSVDDRPVPRSWRWPQGGTPAEDPRSVGRSNETSRTVEGGDGAELARMEFRIHKRERVVVILQGTGSGLAVELPAVTDPRRLLQSIIGAAQDAILALVDDPDGEGEDFIRTTVEWRTPEPGPLGEIDWDDPANAGLTRTEANGGLAALAREGRGALGRILPNPDAES